MGRSRQGAGAADANERGWKDTFRMNPGEVTRVLVRAAPQDANRQAGRTVVAGMNLFPFDPSAAMGIRDRFGFPGGPGYVWHCHIVDHEDNEMMRPFMIVNPPAVPFAALTTESTEDAIALPATVALAPAKPNPSAGNSRISFSLPEASEVELVVYDVAGREVSRLADGRYAAGEHVITFDGQDRSGRLLPNGTYLYRLRTPNAKFVRKLVLVR